MKVFQIRLKSNSELTTVDAINADYFIVDENDHLRVMRNSEKESDPDTEVAAFKNDNWISIIDSASRTTWTK